MPDWGKLVNVMLSFRVKEHRESNEGGFWERRTAGRGWRTAREEGESLAGRAAPLHQHGRL